MGSQGPKVSSCGQRRLSSDWADAQADLSLRWAHRSFCWFCHEVAYLEDNVAICLANAKDTPTDALHNVSRLMTKPAQ